MRENLKSLRETVLGEIKEELRFYQLRLSKLVIVRWPILLQYVANNDWGQFFIFTVSKRTRMFVLYMKSKVFFIQDKKCVNS